MSKRIAACVVASLILFALAIGLRAGQIQNDPGQPATAPAGDIQLLNAGNATTLPAAGPTTAPTTAPAITPEAQALIAQTSAAYRKLKSLELAGVMKFDVDASDQKVTRSIDFTDIASGHNRFRHDGKGDALAGANDKMQYLFEAPSNEYLRGPAVVATSDVDDLIDPLPDFFRHSDRSLLLALSNDPSYLMLEEVAEASTLPDTKIDSQSYPTLKLVMTDKSIVTLLIDPTTHLLRQVKTDLKPMMVSEGQTVDHSLVTVDYTTTTPNAQIKPEAFDWSPPEGAKQMDDPAGAAGALRGKPAPDFTLTYLDGKPASISALKGNVIVLDFWATWCVPCRQSFPSVQALYESQKAAGLHVLAVDAGEDASEVKEFVAKTKLDIPVVMDPDHKGADAFSIEGFPTKVVIGKDGIVTTVLLSTGASVERKLQRAVAAAMAK